MSSPIDYTIYYRTWHTTDFAHAEQQAQSFAASFSRFVPQPSAGPVLDIGCGMGFAMLGLKKLGFQDVAGIDIDAGQVAVAQKHGLNASVVEDSAMYLKDRFEHYELITLFDVLEHVPVSAQIDLLVAIRKALKPGGRLILQVPNANSPLASRWRYNDHTHHSSFTEHSLRFVLLNAAFETVDIVPDEPRGTDSWKLWSRRGWADLRRQLVRFWWKQVIEAELGRTKEAKAIQVDLNMRAIATKPAAAS